MKNLLRFSEIFLIVAWVIFLTNRNVPTSILLLLAAIYMLVEVIPMIREEVKKRRAKR
jgi:hypothetical protein|nr:MAG TPA: hypothetical protein [Caudoviricetes sp.]